MAPVDFMESKFVRLDDFISPGTLAEVPTATLPANEEVVLVAVASP